MLKKHIEISISSAKFKRRHSIQFMFYSNLLSLTWLDKLTFCTFCDLLNIGHIILTNGLSILQKTKLWWFFSGPMYIQSQTHISLHCVSATILESQLTRFWELEGFSKTRFLSDADASCEEHIMYILSRYLCGSLNIPYHYLVNR